MGRRNGLTTVPLAVIYRERVTSRLFRRPRALSARAERRAGPDVAHLLALHRAFLTVVLVALRRADDSCGLLADLFAEAMRGYLAPMPTSLPSAANRAANRVTTDRDYSRFPELRWRHPLA